MLIIRSLIYCNCASIWSRTSLATAMYRLSAQPADALQLASIGFIRRPATHGNLILPITRPVNVAAFAQYDPLDRADGQPSYRPLIASRTRFIIGARSCHIALRELRVHIRLFSMKVAHTEAASQLSQRFQCCVCSSAKPLNALRQMDNLRNRKFRVIPFLCFHHFRSSFFAARFFALCFLCMFAFQTSFALDCANRFALNRNPF